MAPLWAIKDTGLEIHLRSPLELSVVILGLEQGMKLCTPQQTTSTRK